MTAIKLYRVGRWCYERGIPIVPRFAYYLIRLLYHSVIPMSVEIGEGTSLGHCLGIVLHGRCRIGKNVVIAHQVPVGGRSGNSAAPAIENSCSIGPGAWVLGQIRIADAAW